MKAKFKMTGKNEFETTITVEMEAPKYTLTRSEMQKWKLCVQDKIHAVLREDKYFCAQIKLVR